MKKLLTPVFLLLGISLALSACGSDDSAGDSTSTAGNSPTVEISDAWARATTPTQDSGAIYMTIESEAGDTLTGARVPTSIAGKTEIHESAEMEEPAASEESMEQDGSGDSESMDESGAMMGMTPVEEIEIPAGESVALEPGGYHMMLLDLKDQIKAGEKIPVTLSFENAGEVKVQAVARDQ